MHTTRPLPAITQPQSDLEDEALLAEYAATGDRRAFEELVNRYQRDLYAYLRKYLGDDQLAEDATQAAFLQLHLKCRQFESGRSLRPWLYTIARNQAVDLQRRFWRHRPLSLNTTCFDTPPGDDQTLEDSLNAAVVDPQQHLQAAEDAQRLQSVMQTIPARMQQVLNLVIYQGLKYREAAQVLGVPMSTVKSRINLAVRRLRRAFATADAAS